MSAFSKSLASSSLALFILPAIGQAQIVEVEPGYVRAPFVRVYRTPDGGTQVRAPFVDVHSDGTRYRRPPRSPYDLPPVPPINAPAPVTVDTPGIPTQIDVATADWQSLRLIIRTGEAELANRLNRYRAADRWKATLQIGSLSQILTDDDNQPPTGETRDRLQAILDTYDRASINPAFRPVTRLSEFHTVHTALTELLLSPLERKRGQLATAARDLDQTLAQMPNGSHWSDYLRLPDSIFAPDDSATIRNLDELSRVLNRFESVSADRRYGLIAALPAFQATHRHLVDYIAISSPPSLSLPEELPAPPSLD